MKKIFVTKFKIAILILSIITFSFKNFSKSKSSNIEFFYSNGIYKAFSVVFSRLIGIFPFSLVEVIILILIITVIILIVRFVILIIKNKEKRKENVLKWIANCLVIVLFSYVFFNLAWGLNYNRRNAFQIFDLEKQEVKEEVLAKMITDFSKRAKELREELDIDKEGVSKINTNLSNAFKRSDIGYLNLAKKHPELSGKYSKPKPVLMSFVLSYFGLWGFYSPFTFEANINKEVPTPFILTTAAHEMAHQRGIAREDEANYLAYLSCMYHSDIDYIYQGYLIALRYSLNALKKNNQELYLETYLKISKGIKTDIDTIKEFNKKHDNFLNDLSSSINNLFLKANGQSLGIKSYGRMVDLVLAQYIKEYDLND